MNPLRYVPARQRITLGLIGLMVGTLLIASALGFFPNEQKEILRGRARMCETLAISSTAMASAGQIASLEATIESVVQRDEAVLSIGLRDETDALVAGTESHEAHWNAEAGRDIHQMQVPVYRHGRPWANLEVCFADTGGLLGLNYWAPAWLLIVFVPACFIQFSFYLRKTLKHLNPSDRVPQHVQDALDTLSVGLLLLDSSSKVIFGNAEFARSVGLDADSLIGTDASELAWEIDSSHETGEIEADESQLPWIESARTGQAVEDRIIHRLVDGRRRTYSVNCSKVGKGMMAIFDDITLLEKARRAAQEANESKSAFLANMSHEIRTPLNAVLGFTDALRRGLVTDQNEALEHLNLIHRSGKHLLELINDILDLSKIEAGRMDIEHIDTRVDQILFDTVDVLKVKADEKALALNLEFATALPKVISGDPTRLKQIVTNLVGNAIKFTEHGSVTIRAGLTESHRSLQIDIVDTGIGLTESQQGRIFDSFSQADETTTRRFGGTGLGLSISRRLANAMGGEVSVQSEMGHGSTFTIDLPVTNSGNLELIEPAELFASRRQSDRTEQAEITQLPARSVLVVDDGDANRRLIELVLGRAGARVTAAENGLEAIKRLANRDFDLILMDMQMPILDGYATTQRLREVGLKTPIIALTGNAMKGDRERCLEAGCDEFLSKPVDLDQLLRRASHYLGKAPEPEKSVACSTSPRTVALPAVGPPGLNSAHEKSDENSGEPIRSTLPMDDPEFREIATDFIDRLQTRLDDITECLSRCDMEEVKQAAHWLKGAGGTVGFHHFTEPAKRLESAAELASIDQAEQALAEIRSVNSRIVFEDTTDDTTIANRSTGSRQSESVEQPFVGLPGNTFTGVVDTPAERSVSKDCLT